MRPVIQWWKFRRELARLGQQLRSIPEFVWEPFAQRAHDRRAAAGFPVVEGAVPLSGKVAIVLTYQPAGVANSLLAMCDHLQTRGYAPFIVANAPLSVDDRAALGTRVWRMIERPNFGYDFGGYRDALRHLRTEPGIEKVLIFNDSVWFPLYASEDLIDRLEAKGTDVAGTILRVRGDQQFLESYCYLFDARVLADARVREFWDGLRLTSNKYKVIRRGERRHSAALVAAGFSIGAVYSRDAFLARLREQDAGFIRKTLLWSAFHDTGVAAERDRIAGLPDAPEWRDLALAFIERAEAHGQFYSQFPFAMVRLMGYPLLKKSGDRPSTFWRNAFARAVEAGDLPTPDEPFWSEIRDQVEKDQAAAAGAAR